MRTRFKYVLASALLLTGAASAVVSSPAAHAATPAHATYASVNINAYWVCLFGSTNNCQNNWNGGTGNPNPINYYPNPAGQANAVWAFNKVGVTDGSSGCNPCGPFISGSGLNADYNGDGVYQIGLVKNSTWSNQVMDGHYYQVSSDNGTNETTPNVAPCQNIVNGGNNGWENCAVNDLFVFSGSQFLVAVAASDVHYVIKRQRDFPVYLGNLYGEAPGNAVSVSNRNGVPWGLSFRETIEIND